MPEIAINTSVASADSASELLVNYLQERRYL
jgi:hypothetical protein